MLWIIHIFGKPFCIVVISRKMLCLLEQLLMYLGLILSSSHVVSCAWEMQGLMLTNTVALKIIVIFPESERIKLSY